MIPNLEGQANTDVTKSHKNWEYLFWYQWKEAHNYALVVNKGYWAFSTENMSLKQPCFGG